MSVLIRRTESCDFAELARLEKLCFSRPWTDKDIADTISTGQSLFLTAVCDGAVAGYVGMTYAADEGEITNIAVFPEYRRAGIAALLMEKLADESRELGVTAVFLDVRVSNEPAIALYKKQGYELCGTRKRFYDLPTEDAYIFRRDLIYD